MRKSSVDAFSEPIMDQFADCKRESCAKGGNVIRHRISNAYYRDCSWASQEECKKILFCPHVMEVKLSIILSPLNIVVELKKKLISVEHFFHNNMLNIEYKY